MCFNTPFQLHLRQIYKKCHFVMNTGLNVFFLQKGALFLSTQ